MPSISAKAYHNRSLSQLKEHYKSCMDSYECEDLIHITMSLYVKRQEAMEQKKKFGAVDERYMKEAENLLFGEFAAALGIERDSVSAYIAAKIPSTVVS